MKTGLERFHRKKALTSVFKLAAKGTPSDGSTPDDEPIGDLSMSDFLSESEFDTDTKTIEEPSAPNSSHKLSKGTLSYTDDLFGSNKFNPKQYARDYFTRVGMAGLDSEYFQLTSGKERLGSKLQRHIFNNYGIFVACAREISVFEGHLPELRRNLEEYRQVLSELEKGYDSQKDKNDSSGSNSPFSGSRDATRTHKPRTSISSVESLHSSNDTTKDPKWELGILLDLSVCLEERRFDEAIAMILQFQKKMKDNPAEADNILREVRRDLYNSLCVELENVNLTRSQTKSVIGYLIDLDFSEEAQSAFYGLQTRRMKREIRKIKFEGELLRYIVDLSALFFRTVARALEDFWVFFRKRRELMSSFLKWLDDEVQRFCSVFNRQVFSLNNLEAVPSCLQIVAERCDEMVGIGLSLHFLFSQHFIGPFNHILELNFVSLRNSVTLSIAEEDWKSEERTVQGKKRVKITQSGVSLYAGVVQFFRTLQKLKGIRIPPFAKLYTGAISGVSDLFQQYLRQMENVDTNTLDPRSYLSFIVNVFWIAEDLVPRTEKELGKLFGVPVIEISTLFQHYRTFRIASEKRFISFISSHLLDTVLEWKSQTYSEIEFKVSDTGFVPSPPFVKAAKVISSMHISGEIENTLAADFMRNLISAMSKIVRCETESDSKAAPDSSEDDRSSWSEPENIQEGGLTRLLLDVYFLAEYVRSQTGRDLRQELSSFKRKISDKYKSHATSSGLIVRIKPEDWFIKKAEECVSSLIDGI